MESIKIKTSSRTEFLDITASVTTAIEKLGIRDGLATVFVPHTTAGVTINENADPDVLHDIRSALETIVPWNAGYRHVEGNSAAHVKASLMGASAQVIVKSGRLMLGRWQSLFFCEFDGPRTRELWVS